MPPFVEPVKVLKNSAHPDRRHPLYVGDWKRSIPYVDDFAKDDMDEPHFKRKKAILEKHPEITKLYGIETTTKWVTFSTVPAHLFCAYLFGRVLLDWNWTMVIFSYAVGGTLTQVFGSIIHECSHALAHESLLVNRLLGLIVNIGIPVPIAQSFRRYHLEHHTFQEVLGKDPDLPLDWEIHLVRGNVTKNILAPNFPGHVVLLWVKNLLFGRCINPAAAHFIQEYYTWKDGQETYSYYGSMNKLTLNIGFHNEHHDFTRVAWSKLPAVRATAPEFYDTISYHESWFRVLWEFIKMPTFGPQSRLVRDYADHRQARKLFR